MNMINQSGLMQITKVKEEVSLLGGLVNFTRTRPYHDVPCFNFFKDSEIMETVKGNKERSFIEIGKMQYDKKVYVIYNPASGKSVDITSKIHNCFFSSGIDYDLY